MTMTIQTIFSYLSFFLAACVTLGGIFVYRRGNLKTLNDIQERVVTLLEAETKVLREQAEDCRKEALYLSQIIETLQTSLKSMGITITIEGDVVTITEKRGRNSSSVVRKNIIATKDEGKTAGTSQP
jgi:hypothetical protein